MPSSDVYNPTLYLIQGKKLDKNNIAFGKIKFNKDVFKINTDAIEYEELKAYCADKQKREVLNGIVSTSANRFHLGSILEKITETIIPFVDDGNILTFSHEIQSKHFDEIEACGYKCIGRILPPYITRIQQRTSGHIFREGVLPIPENYFG
jgi:hypothetical protein